MISLLVAAGCSKHSREVVPTTNQKYDFDVVRQRAENVRPGMSKLQVLAILGSPAIREPNLWRYLPDRSGYVIPTQALQVEFNNNVVVRQHIVPIVLGAPVQ